MFRTFTVLLLLALTVSGLHAATLKGQILENQLSGPPMSAVEIVAEGANQVTTDNFGRFLFEFPNKHPGDVTQVRPVKPGYVVVNVFQLKQILPADADANVLTLFLCKEENLQEMAARFIGIPIKKEVNETYKQQVKENKSADRATKARFAQERDQVLSLADKMAEGLAKKRPDNTSELEQDALRSLSDGNSEQALQVLSEENVSRALKAAKQQKEKPKAERLIHHRAAIQVAFQVEQQQKYKAEKVAYHLTAIPVAFRPEQPQKIDGEKAIQQAVDAYLLRAKLLVIRFRFEDATKTYEAVIKEVPDSFDAHFEYALFCQLLNRFRPALLHYQRCLELATSAKKPELIAVTLSNLGLVYQAENQMDDARKAYDEALKIRRQLAEANPKVYLFQVANTLNNLGTLYRDQNRMDNARKAYEEALKIHRQLAETNPEAYLPEVAGVLDNLGIVYRAQNRMDDARKAFEEALKINRVFAETNPERFLPYVVKTLNNLGMLHIAQDRRGDASMVFEEALRIQRQLAETNPKIFRREVARTLNILGSLYAKQNRTDDARKAYEEALKIRRHCRCSGAINWSILRP